jgi:hypothetical protein
MQADEYKANDFLTGMELLEATVSEDEKTFDGPEKDESRSPTSRFSTPTPIVPRLLPVKRPPSETPSVHTVNVNYRHCYTLEKTNGTEIDIPELLQTLAKHTTLRTPGKVVLPSVLPAANQALTNPTKARVLRMEGSSKPLRFTEIDIPDSPFLRYGNKMDELITDWNDSSYIHIKNVPIPLKYWSQVYRWTKPDAWKVLKNEWHNWRVPLPRSFGAVEYKKAVDTVSYCCYCLTLFGSSSWVPLTPMLPKPISGQSFRFRRKSIKG